MCGRGKTNKSKYKVVNTFTVRSMVTYDCGLLLDPSKLTLGRRDATQIKTEKGLEKSLVRSSHAREAHRTTVERVSERCDRVQLVVTSGISPLQ